MCVSAVLYLYGSVCIVFICTGTVFTCGPGTYKIPCFGDVPANLRVYLLHNVPNKRAVFFSKGIGEPPLFLGASVFFVIRDDICNVRRQNGEDMFVLLM